MAQIVQAKCPGCKNVLRIPADYLHRPLKCKHCGTVIQARPKPTQPPTEDVGVARTPVPAPRPAKAATAPHRPDNVTPPPAPFAALTEDDGTARTPPRKRKSGWLALAGLLLTLGVAGAFAVLAGP